MNNAARIPPLVRPWAGAKTCTPARKARAFLVMTALCLIALCGCEHKAERPALTTYPVTGKVVTEGKLPVGGCVQFQPVQNGADYTANGIIDAQGRFSLRVPYVDRVLTGAIEGPHAVRVLLPLEDGGAPVPISGTFVVQPQANQFTLEMPSGPAG